MSSDLLTHGLSSGQAIALFTQGLVVRVALITLKPKPLAAVFIGSKPVAIVELL